MSIESFNVDVAAAFSRVKCSAAGEWGSERAQTACPVTACWLLHHDWKYPPPREHVGKWFLAQYGFARDFGEGLIHGFDGIKDNLETRYTDYRLYLDGLFLGQSLAKRWRKSSV